MTCDFKATGLKSLRPEEVAFFVFHSAGTFSCSRLRFDCSTGFWENGEKLIYLCLLGYRLSTRALRKPLSWAIRSHARCITVARYPFWGHLHHAFFGLSILLLSFRFYVRTCLVILLPCFLTCLIHLHLLHPITSHGSTLLSFPLWLQILKCLNMKHLCWTTILLIFCCFPPDYLLHVHLYFDCHKSQHVGTHAEYITTPELYRESRQTFLQ